MARVLPRRLAPVLPTTYSPRYLLLAKANAMHWHSDSPYHTCVYCKGFAAAALRRARTLISVPFSGLPLSWPLLILGLVGRYPTNSLISRWLILGHCFSRKNHFQNNSYIGFYSQFPKAIPNLRLDYQRVTEHSAGDPKVPRTCML